MMKHKILWLMLKTSPNNNLTDNNTEDSIGGNSMNVAQVMNYMMLDKGSDSGQLSHHVGELKLSKRKRTSSQVSSSQMSHLFILVAPFINMPQKDGGRGPIKHHRETDNGAIQSVSPVQPTSDILDSSILQWAIICHPFLTLAAFVMTLH